MVHFSTFSHLKKLWIINAVLACAALFITFPHQIWTLSLSQNNSVKSFDGAIMPLAFVPDWSKSNYVERRQEITYGEISQNDLIPLPDYDNIHTDFNSLFTYITVFKWAYMDEGRVIGSGSHDGVDIRAPMETPIFSIAHGIVSKVRNDDNNKYIVVEHRNVKYKNKIGNYYSSYLHLSSVSVNVWDVITKGTILGKVGMSGITTTPHLHLQIDNEDAPFYPYWPFSLEEAGSSNMSFFDGVSNGLNSNSLDLYSVDPIDFVKMARPIDGKVPIANNTKNEDVPPPPLTATKPIENPIKKGPFETLPYGTFSDVKNWDTYYTAINYFAKKWLLKWFEDGTYRSKSVVTRSEILGIVLNALEIVNHGEILVGIFKDVPKDHWVNPLISEAIKRKIISTDRPLFEPNRAVTRVEFLAILAQASNEKFSKKTTKTWDDLDPQHWSQLYARFAYNYKLFENLSWKLFKPNDSVTRWEIAQAMYTYLKNIGKV